jgi:hypothetical protein
MLPSKTTKPEISPPKDIGYIFRPLVTCSLPVRNPGPDCEMWIRSNPTYSLRIFPGHGIPFGQDRMLLILLATRAVHANSPVIQLGPAYQILRMFGQAPDGRNYRRLMERMRRLFTATVLARSEISIDGKPAWVESTAQVCREHDLWYMHAKNGSPAAYSFENRVVLSEPFWLELKNYAAPVDLNIVRSLLDSPANLDFYMWLCVHAYRTRMGRVFKIPVVGDNSLFTQLGASGYEQTRTYRTKVRQWLRRTKALWPACPAVLTEDGSHLMAWHMPLVHSLQANAFLAARQRASVNPA